MTLDQILDASYMKIVFSDDVPKAAKSTSSKKGSDPRV